MRKREDPEGISRREEWIKGRGKEREEKGQGKRKICVFCRCSVYLCMALLSDKLLHSMMECSDNEDKRDVGSRGNIKKERRKKQDRRGPRKKSDLSMLFSLEILYFCRVLLSNKLLDSMIECAVMVRNGEVWRRWRKEEEIGRTGSILT